MVILQKIKLFMKIWRIPVFLFLLIIIIQIARLILNHYQGGFFHNLLLFLFQVALAIIIIILVGIKHKIIYLYLLILLLTVEIYSRYYYNTNNTETNFDKISKAENFRTPSGIKKIKNITATELKYYEYYLFAPYPFNDSKMCVTGYYSARKVPSSENPGKGSTTIWTFGGSTMLNIETTDSLSIANQIAVRLKEKKFHTVIINFGCWGFQSSLENIKFQELIKHVPVNELPDIVIFYDGYNDAGFTFWFGAGKMSMNSSNKVKAIVEGDYLRLIVFSVFKFIGNISKFWEFFIEPSFNSDFSLFGGYSNKNVIKDYANLKKGVSIYETNTRIIRSICENYAIKPFFILQPMIYTKQHLTDFEKNIMNNCLDTASINEMKLFYSLTIKTMKKYSDFYDYTNILDNSKSNDFYDLGHIGPFTGIKIGKAIADTLIHNLNDSTTQQTIKMK
jgi:hypothetical protein